MESVPKKVRPAAKPSSDWTVSSSRPPLPLITMAREHATMPQEQNKYAPLGSLHLLDSYTQSPGREDEHEVAETGLDVRQYHI